MTPMNAYDWEEIGLNRQACQLYEAAQGKPNSFDFSLTRGERTKKGAVWFGERFSTDESFLFEFGFSMTPVAGPGADGMAFVLQNADQTFMPMGSQAFGGYLGYTGIPCSLAVELDTICNDQYPDAHGQHISVHTGRDKPNNASHAYSLGCATQDSFPGWSLNDGNQYMLAVHYSREQSFLRIVMSNSNRSLTNSRSEETRRLILALNRFNLSDILCGDAFRFGLMGASGDWTQRHKVHYVRAYKLGKVE
jgi:hypothetical protein